MREEKGREKRKANNIIVVVVVVDSSNNNKEEKNFCERKDGILREIHYFCVRTRLRRGQWGVVNFPGRQTLKIERAR